MVHFSYGMHTHQESTHAIKFSTTHDPSLGLFAICEEWDSASSKGAACQAFVDKVHQLLRELKTESGWQLPKDFPQPLGETGTPLAKRLLRYAILGADLHLKNLRKALPAYKAVKIRVVVALFDSYFCHIGCLGETQVFLKRQRSLWPLVAAEFPQREPNSSEDPNLIVDSHRFVPGDVLMLCGQGITHRLTESAITDLLCGEADGLNRTAKAIVQAALNAGKPLSFAVLLVRKTVESNKDNDRLSRFKGVFD